jgi:hypothetical protein
MCVRDDGPERISRETQYKNARADESDTSIDMREGAREKPSSHMLIVGPLQNCGRGHRAIECDTPNKL